MTEHLVATADDLPSLSPTQRLLCACARRSGGPDIVPALAALPLELVDWPSVPGLLVRHGLQALAGVHLAGVRSRMPDVVWQEIHDGAMAARATALALSAELFRLLRGFAGAGVETLPYKGPLLGWEAYGDLGARPSVDLDLLIRPVDFDAAAAHLGELGYQPGYVFPPAAARWFRRVDGDYPFAHHETGTLVELHVRPMSRRFGPDPTTDELLARHRMVSISGLRIALPGADDLFYLQVVHGGKHRWERLEWIAATAEMLRLRHGNVSALYRPPYPNPRAVVLGCRLARDLLGAPVDAETTARIAADHTGARLATDALRHLFDDQRLLDDSRADTSAKLRYNLRLQPGLVARLRFLYRWVCWPSPEDWERLHLPDPLFFGYRLTRPLRLLWRYARRTPHHEDGTSHG